MAELKLECEGCGYTETFTFSKEEVDNLEKHDKRLLTIQKAIPEKPQWVREIFLSGICMCPSCWKKYFGGEE